MSIKGDVSFVDEQEATSFVDEQHLSSPAENYISSTTLLLLLLPCLSVPFVNL